MRFCACSVNSSRRAEHLTVEQRRMKGCPAVMRMRPGTLISLTASAGLGVDAGDKRSPSLRHMGQTRIGKRTQSRSAKSQKPKSSRHRALPSHARKSRAPPKGARRVFPRSGAAAIPPRRRRRRRPAGSRPRLRRRPRFAPRPTRPWPSAGREAASPCPPPAVPPPRPCRPF